MLNRRNKWIDSCVAKFLGSCLIKSKSKKNSSSNSRVSMLSLTQNKWPSLCPHWIQEGVFGTHLIFLGLPVTHVNWMGDENKTCPAFEFSSICPFWHCVKAFISLSMMIIYTEAAIWRCNSQSEQWGAGWFVVYMPSILSKTQFSKRQKTWSFFITIK